MKGPNPSSFWKQVGLLAAKDLRIFFLDRGAWLLALVFPLAFTLMFSLVIGKSFSAPDKPLTVYLATAEPAGSISQQIIDDLTAATTGQPGGTAAGSTGPASGGTAGVEVAGGLEIKQTGAIESRDALAANKIGGYLFFPEGFTDAIIGGEPAKLIVYYNPEDATTKAALVSIGEALANEFGSFKVLDHAVGELAGGGPIPPWPGSAPGGAPAGAPGGAEPGVALTVEKVGDIKPVKAADVLIPGYLTMFVFFALALTAETLVGERETCTLERLVAGSASRLSIVTGKMVGAFARGLVQVAVLWIAGAFIFHIRMGNQPWAVVLVSILLALAASGIGVFLATLAKSRKAAASTAVFVSLGFATFGGSMWPLFVMPQWLQNAAKVTPHAWANSAFNKLMLFGASAANVAPEMLALAVFAVVFGGLAVWRFKVSD